MNLKEFAICLTLSFALLFSPVEKSNAQSFNDFRNPPNECKVMTWWHWINGNVTKSGIKKDLEAMQEVGIGGLILFNVGFYSKGEAPFMSDLWWNHVSYAMQKADSLGLKFGIFNSDGWSMSGGPWISPEESMKQLVWTETSLVGGKQIKTVLPKPEANLIYHDIATLAFPSIRNEKPIPLRIAENVNVDKQEAVTDGNVETSASFSGTSGKIPNLTYQSDNLVSVRRIVFDHIRANNFITAFAAVEYSSDGIRFQKIDKTLPLNLKSESAIKTLTLSFPEIKAKAIRVSIHFNESEKNTPVPFQQGNIGVGEITFFESPRVGLWEPKSGQSKRIRHDRQQLNQKEMAELTEEPLAGDWIVSSDKIVNLAGFIDSGGELNWKAPAGDWTILRLGYTSTGRMNAPASDKGRGLECDKMNAEATRTHFNGYVARMNDLSLRLCNKPLDFMQMESWEAGIQNWTAGFETEFERRNGYSILPWLPVMAGGRVVNSDKESNRFLWDLRRTIAEMMSENYWTVMHQLAAEKGIEVLGEGSGMQHYLYDPILYHKTNDIPMGEFWSNEQGPRADCKNAASVAHVYGKKLVAAESFTGAGKDLWRLAPGDLKKIGDEAFAMGVNQYVLHSYVHQPYDIAPGLTLDQFGNHFQRLNSWYKQADGWLNYIARSQYMLRQGQLVTDVCYFTGEGIPGYLGLRKELSPALPEGYDYDGVNLDKVKEMVVVDGKLVLPNGARYALLAFPETDKMTPALVSEIRRLVAAGATLVSQKPVESPSLSGYPECDRQVKSWADEIWGTSNPELEKEHIYGKGKVIRGISLSELLKKGNVNPDFQYKSENEDLVINYLHRQTGKSDVYFLANKLKTAAGAVCSFRSKKPNASLWDAGNAKWKPLKPVQLPNNERSFQLDFDPQGSAFVVFSDSLPNEKEAMDLTYMKSPIETQTLKNRWELRFPSGSGIQEVLLLDELKDWTEFNHPKIRYFSGTVTYTTTFSANKMDGKTCLIDLGNVKNIARLFLNGVEIANLWNAPFVTDITQYIRGGENQLKIEITNTSVNQLIGDEQLPADLQYKSVPGSVTELPEFLKTGAERESGRHTFVSYQFFNKNSVLEPSGLIGPVKLINFK